ncbi:hypothetical protein Hanom_Chr10g00965241 [Helianthus anomalus]
MLLCVENEDTPYIVYLLIYKNVKFDLGMKSDAKATRVLHCYVLPLFPVFFYAIAHLNIQERGDDDYDDKHYMNHNWNSDP